MDKRTLETILLEQKHELEVKARTRRCRRMEESLVNLDSNLAQVVIGVRRSGKSTLCFNVLHQSGVRYAYVNFDDERLEGLRAADLNNVLETLYKINGEFTHLFLDEIQNDWIQCKTAQRRTCDASDGPTQHYSAVSVFFQGILRIQGNKY